MYTLGGGIHEEQGWGRADETFAVREELAGLRRRAAVVRARRPRPRHPRRADPDARRRLPARRGHRRRCARAGGCRTSGVRLLPMSDDRVETHVVIDDAEAPGGPAGHALPGVLGAAARRAAPPTRSSPVGAEKPRPGPACSRRSPTADVVVLPPSQPGREHRHRPGRARHPRGARRGARTGRRAVADRRRRTGARHGRPGARRDRRRDARRPRWRCTTAPAAGGLLDGWLVDERDADAVAVVEAAGIACRAVPLLMTDVDARRRAWRAPRSTCPPSCGRRRGMSRRSRSGRPTASPRCARATTSAALLARRCRPTRRSRTATSSS